MLVCVCIKIKGLFCLKKKIPLLFNKATTVPPSGIYLKLQMPGFPVT